MLPKIQPITWNYLRCLKYVLEFPFLWYFEGMKKGGERHFHAGQSAADNPHYYLIKVRFGASERRPGTDT
jgi:hypothetical protein